MFNKRGALELSINTIVVIVIGVTILVLGLAFVNKLFGGIDDLGGDTIDKAKDELRSIGGSSDSLLTISPRKINVEQGKTEVVDVIIANLKQNSYLNTFANIENNYKGDIDCIFAESNSEKSKSYDIPSGSEVKISLLVDVNGNSKLGTKSCTINVSGEGITDPDKEDSLFIEVIK